MTAAAAAAAAAGVKKGSAFDFLSVPPAGNTTGSWTVRATSPLGSPSHSDLSVSLLSSPTASACASPLSASPSGSPRSFADKNFSIGEVEKAIAIMQLTDTVGLKSISELQQAVNRSASQAQSFCNLLTQFIDNNTPPPQSIPLYVRGLNEWTYIPLGKSSENKSEFHLHFPKELRPHMEDLQLKIQEGNSTAKFSVTDHNEGVCLKIVTSKEPQEVYRHLLSIFTLSFKAKATGDDAVSLLSPSAKKSSVNITRFAPALFRENASFTAEEVGLLTVDQLKALRQIVQSCLQKKGN